MNEIPFWQRIGTKLTFSLFSVCFVSIALTGYLLISLAGRTLRWNISQRNFQIARRASSEITHYLDDALKELGSIAEILTAPISPLVQDMMLENLAASLGKFKRISLVDRKGRIMADSSLEQPPEPVADPLALSEALQGRTYISMVRLSREHLPYQVISLPIKTFGRVEQALLAELNLRDIWDLMDDIQVGQQGTALLFSEEDIVIAHPDKTRVLTPIQDPDRNRIPTPLGPEGAVVLPRWGSRNGERFLTVYAPVTAVEWIVAIRQPITEAHLPLRLILFQSFIMLAGALLVTAAASLFLSRGFAGPLSRLLEGTVQIRGGDLSHRIKIHGKDEIARLTGAFNRMITSLRQRSLALQDSERRYRLLTESVHDIIFSLSEQGELLFLNRTGERISGYNRKLLLGQSLVNFLSPQSGKSFWKRFQRKLIQGSAGVLEMEIVLLSAKGQEIILEVHLARALDHSGAHYFSGVGRDITERKKAEEKLLSYQQKLRSLASQLSLAEARERKRIASDLHDRIGQSLALTKIRLEALRAGWSGGSQDQEEQIRSLKEALGMLDQIMQDTRTLIFDLSSPVLYELGIAAAVDRLLEQIQEEYGIITRLEHDSEPTPLNDDVAALLFQIVNELLINVVKHAQAKNIIVSVHRDGDKVRIIIEDDGIGFDPSKTAFRAVKNGGYGLFSTRERLGHIGGSMEIDSAPGYGTRVTLQVPLSLEEKTPKQNIEKSTKKAVKGKSR